MNPTLAVIDSGMPRSHSARTPPVRASGTPLKIARASRSGPERGEQQPEYDQQRDRARRCWCRSPAEMSCSKLPP